MREVLIGFDSAWTDNARNPGAIAAYIREAGQVMTFYPPRLATFHDATQFVRELTTEADYTLIAIDQPTIVNNQDGARPVDRVAGSLISKLKGGVQPARRGGSAARMFGDDASIWRFIVSLGVDQNPIEARTAPKGRFLVEVFPALTLPAMVPAILGRGRAAKYNPTATTFDPLDWPLVTTGVAKFTRRLGAQHLADWVDNLSKLKTPRKADQDRLDAAMCLSIALAWRHGPAAETLLIGDERSGYIATVASKETRAILVDACAVRSVSVDQAWERGSASVSAASAAGDVFTQSTRRPADRRPPIPGEVPRAKPATASRQNGPAVVNPATLRVLLVDRARSGQPITYGEVAAALRCEWSQGFGASLARALDRLAQANRKAGEPLLMCLVVNKATRLPGQGFFDKIGHSRADAMQQRVLFNGEVERCRTWPWR
jgi:predicted RNase H-like nuclease